MKYQVLKPTNRGLVEVHTTDDWGEAKSMAVEVDGLVQYFSESFQEIVHWSPSVCK